MNSFIKGLDKVLSFICITLVGILGAGVIISVILRYVFNISFTWLEEVLTILFIGSTFFGAALGIRENEHIAITYFLEKMPLKIRRVIRIIGYAVIIAVSCVILVNSIKWISKVGSVVSPSTGIQTGVYYLIVPISFLFIIFYSFISILSEFIQIEPPVKECSDECDICAHTGDTK